MKKYKLLIHERVFDQISDIQEYVASVGTYIAAVNYSNRLFDEIESITFLQMPYLIHNGKLQNGIIQKPNVSSHTTKNGILYFIQMAITSLLIVLFHLL
ncbi:MAG: hypothetical protein J6T53_03270 [Bacteroidales bacterium]|nr:hypothetical protein [Bacteroidales bacterium]